MTTFEEQYINRLIAAARVVANTGAIEHDSYICSADAGRELRAALWALDNLNEQRDREYQEQLEQEGAEAEEKEEPRDFVAEAHARLFNKQTEDPPGSIRRVDCSRPVVGHRPGAGQGPLNPAKCDCNRKGHTMKRPITADQLRIAELVSLGWRDREIANDLGVSYDAVRQRLRTLSLKIGATNRAMVAAWYVRRESSAQ